MFKGSKSTFKGSKFLMLHEDRTYPHQFISIMLSELVSTTIELRTQWMWRFSTKTIVSTNSSSSCFNSTSSALLTCLLRSTVVVAPCAQLKKKNPCCHPWDWQDDKNLVVASSRLAMVGLLLLHAPLHYNCFLQHQKYKYCHLSCITT